MVQALVSSRLFSPHPERICFHMLHLLEKVVYAYDGRYDDAEHLFQPPFRAQVINHVIRQYLWQ